MLFTEEEKPKFGQLKKGQREATLAGEFECWRYGSIVSYKLFRPYVKEMAATLLAASQEKRKDAAEKVRQSKTLSIREQRARIAHLELNAEADALRSAVHLANTPTSANILMGEVRKFVGRHNKLFRSGAESSGFGDAAMTTDDFVQDAVIDVWKAINWGTRNREAGLPQIENGQHFVAYVNRICRNNTADAVNYYVNQRKTRVSIHDPAYNPDDIDAENDGYTFDGENPEIYGGEANVRTWFYHIPKTVQCVDRRIIRLMMDGKKLAAVGRGLNMPESSVKTRLFRLRKQMKAEGRCGMLV